MVEAAARRRRRRRRQPYRAFGVAVLVVVLAVGWLIALEIARAREVRPVLSVHVSSAWGIAPGDSVWLSGLRVGAVARIDLLRDGTVSLRCVVDPGVTLPEGAKVAVTTGALGDRRVEIVTRPSHTPDDKPNIVVVRVGQNLRTSPLDPLARDAGGLQARALRVAAGTQRAQAASLAASRALGANLRVLAAQTQAEADRKRALPAFAPPRLEALHRPVLRHSLPRAQADGRRAQAALARLRGLLDDPVLRDALSRDERAVRAAAAAWQGLSPRPGSAPPPANETR